MTVILLGHHLIESPRCYLYPKQCVSNHVTISVRSYAIVLRVSSSVWLALTFERVFFAFFFTSYLDATGLRQKANTHTLKKIRTMVISVLGRNTLGFI